MYNHVLFFGYIIAAFSALVAVLIILIVQKHDADKKGLYRKTLNFVIVSFLVEFNYFLSFYKETTLNVLTVGPVWRTFDYIVWIIVYFFWVMLMDELIKGAIPEGKTRLSGHKKFFKYVIISSVLFFSVACIFFMDDYYIVKVYWQRIYLYILTAIFCIICFYILGRFCYQVLQDIPNFLPRIYASVVTVALLFFQLIHANTDTKLYMGVYGFSGWAKEIIDPVWLIFLITNIATIIFIYMTDFSPVYYSDKHGENIDLPNVDHKKNDIIKLNRVSEMHRLTQREREVLFLAYAGMTNPEISEKLFISRNTVKKHMHSIFEKLDVSTRMEIVHLVNSQNF